MAQQSRPSSQQPQGHAVVYTGVLAGIAEAVTPAILAAFHRFDGTPAGRQEMRLALTAVVTKYAHAAATHGVQQYQQTRHEAAQVAGEAFPKFTPKPSMASRSDIAELVSYLESTLDAPPDYTDVAAGETAAKAGSERLIIAAARDTVTENVQRDKAARGYARVAKPDACWWCAMIASRDVVYKTEEEAGGTGHLNRRGDEGYHNFCRCEVVPVFGRYRLPLHQKRWQKLWNDSTRDVSGMQGKQRAFQEAYLGREVKHRDGKSTETSKLSQPLGFDHLSVDQLQHQLDVIHGLKDSPWRTAQISRFQARIAELSKSAA